MQTLYTRSDAGVEAHSSIREALKASQDGEKILFVCPHDDDAVIGAGMTISLLADEGVDIHIGIITDGRMGYCRMEDRNRIIEIRKQETITSYKLLGVPEKNLHFLGFGDGLLYNYIGRRPAQESDPAAAGFTGLQNALTHLFRKLKPTRIFTPAGTDLHPDHQAIYKETLISIFHAGGDIWPELGAPITIPEVYDYPVYVNLDGDPDTMIEGDAALLQKKLDAIACFASQLQIETQVRAIREAGPVEFYRNLRFAFYHPRNYISLFKEA